MPFEELTFKASRTEIDVDIQSFYQVREQIPQTEEGNKVLDCVYALSRDVQEVYNYLLQERKKIDFSQRYLLSEVFFPTSPIKSKLEELPLSDGYKRFVSKKDKRYVTLPFTDYLDTVKILKPGDDDKFLVETEHKEGQISQITIFFEL